jgi:hypothetical protein
MPLGKVSSSNLTNQKKFEINTLDLSRNKIKSPYQNDNAA